MVWSFHLIDTRTDVTVIVYIRHAPLDRSWPAQLKYLNICKCWQLSYCKRQIHSAMLFLSQRMLTRNDASLTVLVRLDCGILQKLIKVFIFDLFQYLPYYYSDVKLQCLQPLQRFNENVKCFLDSNNLGNVCDIQGFYSTLGSPVCGFEPTPSPLPSEPPDHF